MTPELETQISTPQTSTPKVFGKIVNVLPTAHKGVSNGIYEAYMNQFLQDIAKGTMKASDALEIDNSDFKDIALTSIAHTFRMKQKNPPYNVLATVLNTTEKKVYLKTVSKEQTSL